MSERYEPEPSGLIGVALKLGRKAGERHGDPKAIRKAKELMRNVRGAEKKAFVSGFFDEIGKLAQVPQISQPPMPKFVEQKLYQTGSAFQRGRREKSLKMEAPKAPLTH